MLVLTLLLALARSFAVVGQALGLACAVVNLWGGAPFGSQLPWLALFLCCFVARQAVANAQGSLLDRYAAERAADLRHQLLSCVFGAGPKLTARLGSASVSHAAIDGIEDAQAYLSLIIPKIVCVVAVPLVLLVAIFALDWVSGAIALVCYPFIILYMVMIGHTAHDDAARRHGEFQRMANHFMDSVAGIDELKAFGRSCAYEQRIFAASERFREMTMKTLRIATLSSTVLDLFSTLALAGVAVMLGFRLVDGSMAFFPALAVLIMTPEYFRPIREFAADYHASLDGRSALAAIRAVIEESGCEAAAARRADAGCVPALALDVRGVGFAYPDRPDALRDVHLRVQGPCKVGIVGASGSGKSTLMMLLGGFADPTCGSLALDGCEVPTLGVPAWQRRACFIPQDPYIFRATLRENVALYCPDATDEEVMRAVRLAGLDALAAELPEGINTEVGQGARGLSGGQAHRVALARAFLDGSRQVLLLDEPTAHLDIETEYELKQRLLPLMEGKLVFFATHRLHWMEQMDYVLELREGRVAWQGPFSAWLRQRRAEGGSHEA